MPDSLGLQCLVLGPLEVRVDADVVALGGPQQRLLFAALLLHANSVVSADTLTDIVWGDDAVLFDAPTRLAKSVYRLRAALGSAGISDCLITRSPGYLLSVPTDGLDSSRFEALLSDVQGRVERDPAQALERLTTALALWRGPAWAEVADQDFVQPEVARLDGLRADAEEQRTQTLLALGRHDELVRQLPTLIERYPLREPLRAQLMHALYLSGRPAEAVTVYRSFRTYLGKEMGLEPSAELQRLEADLLNQRIPSELRLRRGRSDIGARNEATTAGERFVGRRRELSWLKVLLDRAGCGRPPVVAIVSGDQGTGKSSLLQHFGALVRSRGGTALFVRCDREDSVLEAVAAAVGARGDVATASRSPDEVRTEIETALSTFEDNTPVLVVLDDVDADRDDARAALAELASVPSRASLLTVAVCRGPVAAIEGVEYRRLAGLERADVAELLARVSGADRSPELVESVCAETGAIPALVTGVGRRLRELDVAARADRALARADATRESWAAIHVEVADGVLARTQRGGANSGDPHAESRNAPCPYKGLASFGVADAAFFAGRERMIAELIARLALGRFLTVVGASGSGKSSLLAAGLVPALASGALPGSEHWTCRLIRPGPTPVHALATALAPSLGRPIPAVEEQLRSDQIGAWAEPRADGAAGTRIVLVVDQFEEVFTACSDPAERDAFIRTLVRCPALPGSPILVAVALRADHYQVCAEDAELAGVLGHNQILLHAMTDAELRRAVLEPARRAGLTVEAGLAEQVVEEAAGEPGALPLVSTALLETWIRRSDSTLTLAGYTEAGGVRGAVGRLADSLYDRLDAPGRAICRRMFLRLADADSERTDVRRRAQREELAASAAEQVVLSELIDQRLLTASEDTVEVAHEALLREWPRLRGWLEEDRVGRRLHRHLTRAAMSWDANQRDEGDLYRGVRLSAARDWDAAHPGDANLLESEFLAASDAAQDHTLHAARRTTKRLRRLSVALTALLAAAMLAGILAALQRSQARHAAAVASTRELQADVSRLALLARTLPRDQRDLMLLLGAQGFEMDPSDEAAGGLQAALMQTPAELDRIIRYPSASFLPQVSHDGRLLAVGTSSGVSVYDLATGTVRLTLHWQQPRDSAVWSRDDSLIAAGGEDGKIAIWDATTGQPAGAALPVGGNISYAAFDPTDDHRLYASTDHGILTTWDRTDPQHPRRVGPERFFDTGGHQDVMFVTVSADGRQIAAGDAAGWAPTTVWNLDRGGRPHTYPAAVGSFAARGATLPVSPDKATVLYNARTGTRITAIPVRGVGNFGAVLSGDGRLMAQTQTDPRSWYVRVYDVASREPLGAPLRLHGNGANALGFLPDGRLLTTGNNEAAIWTIGRSHSHLSVPLPSMGEPTSTVFFLPGRHQVVTVGAITGNLIRHDATTGASLGPLLPGKIRSPIAPSPDGSLVAASDTVDDNVGIWDLASGKRLAVLPGVSAIAKLDWSSDRRLVTDSGPAVQLWSASDPRHPSLIASIPPVGGSHFPQYLSYSRDGDWVLTADSEDKRLTVFNTRTRTVQWTRTFGDLHLDQATFSPDGTTIAVGVGNFGSGTVHLYSSATGFTLNSVATQSEGGLAYMHGGKWLAVSNYAAPNVQLYDAHTLDPIGIPFPTPVFPGSAEVTADAAGTMFSKAEDGLLWHADPAHWLATACRIAGRNLTQAEWHRYLPTRPYHATCPQWPGGR